MFKRANKITSLLVTAAAVMSLVPAYAADVKKIDSEDGTVYNAVAYKDGKTYVDGGINDKDDATYYLADGKYNALADIDSGSDIEAYGSKYVNVQSGDYFLDLETGKVTDDSIKSDAQDDIASALRKAIKKDTDGRYVEGTGAKQSEVIQDLDTANLPGSKFGDLWYGVKYSNKDNTNGYTASGSDLNVYTDAKGNYIDADYNLGKIKVTTTASGSTSKIVSIENTDDTYDADGNAANPGAGKVSAKVDSTAATVIGQDKDYIYRTAKITVTAANGASITEINGVAVSKDTATFTATHNALGIANTVAFNVIQKISKTQASGDIGGAKYAKTVTTYVISGDDGSNKFGDLYSNYTVVDGKLINYKIVTGTSKDKIYSQTITLKAKNGYYYTDFADSDNEDVEKNDSSAYDVDSNGNLWRLDGGYIYKWNNDADWDKVYKVDGSFNELSVYDKDNMVSWNEDDEVYSVIGGKTKEEVKPVTPEVKAGWAQATDGTWTYVKADGTKATGWLQLGSAWYYLKADGVMATGWVLDGTTWYFLNANGSMATGWLQVGSDWYYLNANGSMAANTTIGGYVLGANGAWVK